MTLSQKNAAGALYKTLCQNLQLTLLKDALNSSVFSWRRNAKYVHDVLTNEGNAFHISARYILS